MTEDSKPASLPPKRWKPRVLRVVRRVHMYLGILLMPWLALYGLSGVLFNHPNLFETVEASRVGGDQLGTDAAWQADAAAKEVLSALRASGAAYELDRSFPPQFTGHTMLSTDATDGKHLLFVNVERGVGVRVHRKRPAGDTDGRLSPVALDVPQYSMAHWEQAAEGLLEGERSALGRFKATKMVAPKLRLRVRDKEGDTYNLIYDTYSGQVSGRRSSAYPTIAFSQWMATLHTTHHFPLKLGPLAFWALFQDLLGLAMVLWALTGLVMWWQIKRTRVIGAVALVSALAIAGWVTAATSDHLYFGDVRAVLGPGE